MSVRTVAPAVLAGSPIRVSSSLICLISPPGGACLETGYVGCCQSYHLGEGAGERRAGGDRSLITGTDVGQISRQTVDLPVEREGLPGGITSGCAGLRPPHGASVGDDHLRVLPPWPPAKRRQDRTCGGCAAFSGPDARTTSRPTPTAQTSLRLVMEIENRTFCAQHLVWSHPVDCQRIAGVGDFNGLDGLRSRSLVSDDSMAQCVCLGN